MYEYIVLNVNIFVICHRPNWNQPSIAWRAPSPASSSKAQGNHVVWFTPQSICPVFSVMQF